jgi:hypothetical protein
MALQIVFDGAAQSVLVSTTMLTWDVVDSLAAELLGDTAKARNNRRMWRARGRVPWKHRAELKEIGARRGLEIGDRDFDAIATDSRESAA